jgi:hypothetical protein
MANKKSNARKFNGLSYREVQSINSSNRAKLKKEDQKWLRENGYKNVGWDNIISLYEKIKDFLDRDKLDELTLEDLFLEADRIGNKYQTSQEIEEFNQKLSQEIGEISVEIDNQFPDTEIEFIDFSGNATKKRNSKSYKTVKL